MIYRCENCGGNVVYEPERRTMYCPYCDSQNSEKKITEGKSLETCVNCGGELEIDDYTSASQCPYCSRYIIFDERVEGEYEPRLIIPFMIGKKQAQEKIKEHVKGKIFIPNDFYSEAKLNSMQGRYVPFWLYDYQVKCKYRAIGTKVSRVWSVGDVEYTERADYQIIRDMNINFDKVPADDSIAMDDSVMDLLEPYDYRALEEFKTEYMSGFYGERYNQGADIMEERAKEKVRRDAEGLLKDTISDYASLQPTCNDINVRKKTEKYTLFPAWLYTYRYAGRYYQFHVNGQTGKVIGSPPISKGKVCAYGLTVWAGLTGIMLMVKMILEVL